MVTDTIINMKMKEKFRKGLNANVNFFAEINQFCPFNENYNYVKNSKYMSKHSHNCMNKCYCGIHQPSSTSTCADSPSQTTPGEKKNKKQPSVYKSKQMQH